MSSSKVMSSVSNSFKFASEKTVGNLVEYVRRENIEINQDDLQRILKIVESSIDQAFVLTSASIEKTLE